MVGVKAVLRRIPILLQQAKTRRVYSALPNTPVGLGVGLITVRLLFSYLFDIFNYRLDFRRLQRARNKAQ